LNYRFSGYDYVIFGFSYVFFFLFVSDAYGTLPFTLPAELPAWIFLVLAVLCNLWVLPIPGIHPRRPPAPEISGVPGPAKELPEGEAALPAEKKPLAKTPREKLEQGLVKTHKGFVERLSSVFKRSSRVDEVLPELEETLVGTDIGVKTAYALFDYVKKHAGDLSGTEAMLKAIKQQIFSILEQRQEPLDISDEKKPFVIMVTGVNGSGKTTTIAKIAYRLKNEGKSVIIASGDTFRAAAIEQLEHWATRVNADFIKAHQGADPSAVAFDGLQAAISRNHDVLIIDTAGRLHTKENLMEELKKTKRVLDKKLPGAPHEILLVLDATIGQNAIEQTRQFNNALGITGIAITKLDGSSKGGVIVGIANEFSIPIRFIGVGEDMDDLQSFQAESFVNALFIDN